MVLDVFIKCISRILPEMKHPKRIKKDRLILFSISNAYLDSKNESFRENPLAPKEKFNQVYDIGP